MIKHRRLKQLLLTSGLVLSLHAVSPIGSVQAYYITQQTPETAMTALHQVEDVAYDYEMWKDVLLTLYGEGELTPERYVKALHYTEDGYEDETIYIEWKASQPEGAVTTPEAFVAQQEEGSSGMTFNDWVAKVSETERLITEELTIESYLANLPVTDTGETIYDKWSAEQEANGEDSSPERFSEQLKQQREEIKQPEILESSADSTSFDSPATDNETEIQEGEGSELVNAEDIPENNTTVRDFEDYFNEAESVYNTEATAQDTELTDIEYTEDIAETVEGDVSETEPVVETETVENRVLFTNTVIEGFELDADSDGDGVDNLTEVLHGTHPFDANSVPNVANAPLYTEESYELDQDYDGDGYTNLEELAAQTDPNNAASYPGSETEQGSVEDEVEDITENEVEDNTENEKEDNIENEEPVPETTPDAPTNTIDVPVNQEPNAPLPEGETENLEGELVSEFEEDTTVTDTDDGYVPIDSTQTTDTGQTPDPISSIQTPELGQTPPPINTLTTDEQNEAIPYKVYERLNTQLMPTERRVIQEGKSGLRRNGEVVLEPLHELAEVGSKEAAHNPELVLPEGTPWPAISGEIKDEKGAGGEIVAAGDESYLAVALGFIVTGFAYLTGKKQREME